MYYICKYLLHDTYNNLNFHVMTSCCVKSGLLSFEWVDAFRSDSRALIRPHVPRHPRLNTTGHMEKYPFKYQVISKSGHVSQLKRLPLFHFILCMYLLLDTLQNFYFIIEYSYIPWGCCNEWIPHVYDEKLLSYVSFMQPLHVLFTQRGWQPAPGLPQASIRRLWLSELCWSLTTWGACFDGRPEAGWRWGSLHDVFLLLSSGAPSVFVGLRLDCVLPPPPPPPPPPPVFLFCF